MNITFWIRRFAIVFLGASTGIAAVQFLKGHDAGYSVTQGALWGLLASTVFTATRLYRSRRGEHCALCNDIPGSAATRDGQAP